MGMKVVAESETREEADGTYGSAICVTGVSLFILLVFLRP